MLIEATRQDPEHGVYYAFPFLAGTRPSEQLGLLREDVDFERNVIRIRRIQERNGSLTDMTKTAAGTRDVPMGATLREMLLAWRLACPRLKGNLYRLSRFRATAALAHAEDGRRRAVALPEFPHPVLGATLQATCTAVCDAA